MYSVWVEGLLLLQEDQMDGNIGRGMETRISGSWEIVEMAIKAQRRVGGWSYWWTPTFSREEWEMKHVQQCELTGNEEQFRNQQSLFQIGKLTLKRAEEGEQRLNEWMNGSLDGLQEAEHREWSNFKV